ncbi:Retrovirus-related Pol polyprotein from transposon TNT 1-94, partial [Stegodyphus mimosarum]
MKQESIGGSCYYICFTDDFSEYRKVYLKHKSEIVAKFEEFCTFFQNQTEKPIKAVLSDGGLEYINKGFKNTLRKLGPELRCSLPPIILHQNGTAERTNRTLDLARKIMIVKSLPKSLWAELVNTAVYRYTLNHARTPSVDD